jgi:hypothetical protein
MEFNKTAFNNTVNVMTLVQEQTERMITLSLEQAALLPKEGKKVMTDWLKAYRQGEETFKKAVDDSFKTVEAFLAK